MIKKIVSQLWYLLQRNRTNTSFHFLMVYISILLPLLIVGFIFAAANSVSFLKMFFFLSLLSLPVTFIVCFLVGGFSSSLVNMLHGSGKKEDHSEEIINSEVVKVIKYKERGEYDRVLTELTAIEELYGVSSRLIYERASCMIKQGELYEARKCVKKFLSGTKTHEQSDAYCNYCTQLLSHKDSPLRLENVVRKSG